MALTQDDAFVRELDALLKESSGDGDTAHAVQSAFRLLQAALTAEIRDLEWPTTLYETLWKTLFNCWHTLTACGATESTTISSSSSSSSSSNSSSSAAAREAHLDAVANLEVSVWQLFKALSTFPEYDAALATIHNARLDGELVSVLLQRSFVAPSSSAPLSMTVVRQSAHWLYVHRPDLRPALRLGLCEAVLLEGAGRGRGKDAGSSRDHVGPLLDVLLCVVEGLREDTVSGGGGGGKDGDGRRWQSAAAAVLRDLVAHALLPLHRPDEMVEWRDQVPVLQRYHEPLVMCLSAAVVKSRALGGAVFMDIVVGLVAMWPKAFSSNTPKEVLLLHELEALLALATADEFAQAVTLPAVLDRLAQCVGGDTDNFRTMQRALQIFKNYEVLQRTRDAPAAARDALFAALLPAMFRGGKLSWNPTVNKMTALALRNLRDVDEAAFVSHANATIATAGTWRAAERASVAAAVDAATATATELATATSGAKRARPPVPLMAPVAAPERWNPRAGGPPPLGITGVAPWAVMTTAVPQHSGFKPAGRVPPMHGAVEAKATDEPPASAPAPPTPTGHQALLAFMDQCLPPPPPPSASSSSEDTGTDWNALQAAPTPTLLPSLKFHDLVFGHELGRGAFGTVKYARRIDRGRPRSDWPEYAVKVVSVERLDEAAYHASATREMAVLQLLSHPGVARLVSAFRYNRAAYLVLEYCGRGDLHTLVIRGGGGRVGARRRGAGPTPLDSACTRFVVGEVAAALLSLHDLGFAYNDLKPENVLVTEIGHVKVADFGACRPATSEARELLRASTAILSVDKLRDGDWRERKEAEGKTYVESTAVAAVVKGGGGCGVNDDDDRTSGGLVEGTPAYLPPEVLRGEEPPSLLSDAWALGCVAWFCRRGRPLFTGASPQEVLEQMAAADGGGECKEVTFAVGGSATAPDNDADADAADEADFIGALLHRDARRRMTLRDALAHPYLAALHPLQLHFRPPAVDLPHVDAGAGEATGADEQLWARRQFSSLWAPMPATYGKDGGGEDGTASGLMAADKHPLTAYALTAIEETDEERGAPFVARGKPGRK